MTERVQCLRLQVASQYRNFIEQEVLPGTGIAAAAFWAGFDSLVHDLAPQNRALLAERDRLQAELDAWHRANPGPVADMAANGISKNFKRCRNADRRAASPSRLSSLTVCRFSFPMTSPKSRSVSNEWKSLTIGRRPSADVTLPIFVPMPTASIASWSCWKICLPRS